MAVFAPTAGGIGPWTITGCAPTFGALGSDGFGGDGWPPACWRPYSRTSPFNRPVRPGAGVDASSPRIVRRLTGFGPPAPISTGLEDTADDFGRPTYYARPGDPQFRLECTERWGVCRRSDGIPLANVPIRIPDSARPAGGSDAHLTLVDAPSGWEYDLWGVQEKPRGGGTLRFRWGGATPIDGDGLRSPGNAAWFGNLAGIVRSQELQAGRIDHALLMIVKCASEERRPPALGEGQACSEIGLLGEDAPAMGAHFRLDMSLEEIEARRAPGWQKTILRAMAEYGAYVGDTGTASWGIQVESDSSYTSLGRQPRLHAFARGHGWEERRNAGRTVYLGDFGRGVDWRGRLRLLPPAPEGLRSRVEAAGGPYRRP